MLWNFLVVDDYEEGEGVAEVEDESGFEEFGGGGEVNMTPEI